MKIKERIQDAISDAACARPMTTVTIFVGAGFIAGLFVRGLFA